MAVLFFKNNNFPKVKIGEHFDQEKSFAHENGVAFSTDRGFFASGLNHGGDLHFLVVQQPDTTGLKQWVFKSFGDSAPYESDYVPGTFYKRIWRPQAFNVSFHKAISQEKLNESFVALRILLKKMEELFEVVEPARGNLTAYGHKMREILLLACMEVESAWSAVLKENGYPEPRTGYSTNDYVKLLHPMLLDAYELSLRAYPSLSPFFPFKDWDSTRPTASLSWYNAYNKTKHDRETNLPTATLENVIHAVGAVVIVFKAQFGPTQGIGFTDRITPLINDIFAPKGGDFKKYEKSYYIADVDLDGNLQPHPKWDWKPVTLSL